MSARRPPRPAVWILRTCRLGTDRAAVEADLLELYETRAADRGRWYAARRYYADVFSVWWRVRPSPRAAGASLPRGLARWLTDLRADAVYATRVMRRQPTFAVVAIVSLAFGVGANTLVFSVVNALILRPLPVARPSELVFVQPSNGYTLSFPAYRDLRDRNDTLVGMFGSRVAPMSLEPRDAAVRVWGYLVTGNYFDLLGLTPAAGRFFHQSDDQPPAFNPVAVLSFDCWQGRFAGDPAVVGSTIHINGAAYVVLGVAPRGFVGTELFYRPEIWVPMAMEPQIEARSSWLDERMTWNTMVTARLRPGVSAAQAEANLQAVATDLAREHPKSEGGLRLRVSRPGLVGDSLRAPLEAFTIGVLVLAGLTLLMACVNLAVVLTASGADRQRELAIRLSIGAGAGRLRRQVLTETLLLSLAGGAAGALLASLAAHALSAWRLPVELPVQFDITPDPRVFLFALAASLLSGLVFGLAPARQAARTDPNAALKGVAAEVGRRRWSLRDALVVVQVAVGMVLVASCLLALRGLQLALTRPIGLQPDGVTIAGFDLGLAGYDEARGRDFERRAIEAVRQLPGVEAAAYSDTMPLNIDQSTTIVVPDDRSDLPSAAAPYASRYRVSSGFFHTLGVRLLQGRDVDDRPGDAPAAAVVNEAFVRQLLRTDAPIGRRFRYGWSGAWIEVIGVVEDGKYQSLNEPPRPAVFEPIAQHYSSNGLIEVRSALPPDQVVTAVRAALAGLDPRLPLYETQSLEDMLALVLMPSRLASMALGAFGALALLLAVTGLHGVVTNAVSRRQREIGIRLAIGARPGDVIRLVVLRTLVLLGVGAVAGVAIVLAAGRTLASVVYDASPRDPLVLAGVGLTLLVIGIASCWAPVRRALAVNPTDALRVS